MEKIEFEEGKIIEPAKVNEDNTITPAVWEGKTPLSPFVLNKLQDNIENDQVTQNKAIIKCLQEIETPTPVSGESLDIKDSAEARITEFNIGGNSKQETREGKENICNIKSIFNGNGNAIKATYNTDRSMTFEKIADINAVHFGFILKDTTTQNISLYMKYKIETSKESCTIGTRLDSGFFTDSTALDITGNISEITWTGKSAGKNISSLAFSSSGLNLGDKITVYSIYAVLGDTFEPIVPSLDYRSEVKCCGDNVNLFDGLVSENNKRIATGTGGSYATNNYSISDYIEIKSNTSYVINTSYDSYYAYYDSNKKYLTGSVFKNDVKSFSNISNVKYIRFDFKTDEKNSIKLEKGTVATSYSPHGQGCITENICNENLYDGSNFNVSQAGSSFKILLKENKDYTLAFKKSRINGVTISNENIFDIQVIRFYNSNDELLSEIKGTMYSLPNDLIINLTKQFKTPNSTSYALFHLGNNNGDSNINTLVSKIQLIEGTELGDFQEHKEQKYIIPTQAEMLEGDYFDWDNEEEVHTWNKIVFNGTEDFDKITIDELNVFVFKTVEMDYKYINNDICNYKCNLFKAIKVNERYLDNTLYINGGKKIAITSNNFTSVAELQSYLTEQYNAGTPLVVYYKLAKETRLAFTDEQKAIAKELKNAKTYDKITHIYSTDEISPNIELTYKKNMEILFTNTLVESGV